MTEASMQEETANAPPRVNSPVFRIALTISFLWLLWTSVAGYTAYRNRTILLYSEAYNSHIAACQTVTDVTGELGRLSFVDKPNPDRTECEQEVVSEYQGYDDLEVEKIIEQHFERAFIPVIFLLLLAATFRDIISALSISVKKYWLWVIGNSQRP